MIPADFQKIAILLANDATKVGQSVFMNQIIRIHEPDIIFLGSVKPCITGSSDTAVGLFNKDDTRMLGGAGGNDGSTAVRRAVVHADDLIFFRGDFLLQQGMQTLEQIGFGVN